MSTYLDDNGNPIQQSTGGKTYLDDNGNPIGDPTTPPTDTRTGLQQAFQPITSAIQGAVPAAKWLYNQAMDIGPQAGGAAIGGAIGFGLGGPPGMAIGAGLGAGGVGTIERMAGTKPTAPTVGGQLAQAGLDIAGGVLQEAGPAIAKTTPANIGPEVTKGVQKQMMQAIKVRGNKPYFGETLQRAVPDINAAAKGQPINTMRDAFDLIPDAKKEIWAKYKSIIQANDARAQAEFVKAQQARSGVGPLEQRMALQNDPSVIRPMQQEMVERTVTGQQSLNKGVDALTIDGNEVADAMVKSIHPRTARQNPAWAENIRQLADTYRHRMDLQETEDFLQGVNEALGPIFAQGPDAVNAARRAPETAHLFAEEGSLMKQLYAKLDELPGTNAAELKRRYGALTELQKQLSRRLPKIESESPMGLAEQIGWMEAGGKALGHLAINNPIKAATTIGYPLAARYAKGQNHPDALIRKAFEDYNAGFINNLPPDWVNRLIPILARTQGNNNQP